MNGQFFFSLKIRYTWVVDKNPDLFANQYRIKSTRLPQWDYSQPWWYFVTVCTKGGVCHLGDVVGREMRLSEVGEIAKKYWQKIPEHFDSVSLDEFIVMPNHIHGIVIIERQQPTKRGRDGACPEHGRDAINRVSTTGGVTGRHNPMSKTSLGTIVRWYKGRCTFEIHKTQKNFAWQTRFYDHIIRSEKSLEKIRFYIHHNAKKWEEDKYHPRKLI